MGEGRSEQVEGRGLGEPASGGTERKPVSSQPWVGPSLGSRLPALRGGHTAGPQHGLIYPFYLDLSRSRGGSKWPQRPCPCQGTTPPPPGGGKLKEIGEQSWWRRPGVCVSGFLRSCWESTQTHAQTGHHCSASSSAPTGCKRGSRARQGPVTWTGPVLQASHSSHDKVGGLWRKGKCWVHALGWPETLEGSYFYLVRSHI